MRKYSASNSPFTCTILLLLSLFSFYPSLGQKNATSIDFSRPIPLDPAVRYGKLNNGFTYYLRKNSNPKNRVMMRLVIKTGGLYEAKNEYEIAHWLEHLAFRGTTNYPIGLMDYFEMRGLKRGDDTQGAEEFIRTYYEINNIPANDVQLIKDGLGILRDITTEIQFDSLTARSEAGAVYAESNGANYQSEIHKQLIPHLLNYSKYSLRISAPRKQNLNEFNFSALLPFYKKWYRPDLEGIIIVGDTDMALLEEHIKTLFSDLKKPEDPVEIKEEDINPIRLTGKNKLIIITHKDQPDIRIELYYKNKERNPLATPLDYRCALLGELYTEMMRNRFEIIMNQADPRLSSARNFYGDIAGVHAVDGIETSLTVDDTSLLKMAFQLLVTELERVTRHGFERSELESAKEVVSKRYSANRLSTSMTIVRSLTDHYTSKSAAPSPEYLLNMIKTLLENITLTEINSAAKSWIKNKDRDIVFKAPEKSKESLPTEAMINAWMKQIKNKKILKYIPDTFNARKLIPHGLPESKAEMLEVSNFEDLGITQYRLNNGITILLRPSESPSNQIFMRGISPGGTSLYKGHDYISAILATSIIRNSGVAGISEFNLTKYLNKKRIKVMPYMDENFAMFNGLCEKDDLETLLQTVYQYFTAPNKSESAFQTFLSSKERELIDRPSFSFQDTINAVIRHENKKQLNPNNLKLITLNKVHQVYQEQFSQNAGNFTFLFTGNLKPASALPIITKYLGGLRPTGRTKRNESLNQLDTLMVPEKGFSKIVYSDTKLNGAQVRLIFNGNYTNNAINNTILNALATILNIELRQRLREVEGGIYYVYTDVIRRPTGQYSFNITFECNSVDVRTVQNMIAAAMEEINLLQEHGADSLHFRQMIELERASIQSKLDGIGLVDYFTEQYKKGEDISEILEWSRLLDQLTLNDIRRAANVYLHEEKFMKFILL